MSEWEAANISSSFENDNESLSHHSNSTKNNNLDHHNHDSNHDKNTNPKETPEAAIARLTTAYNTAMNAVGALYKLNDAISAKQKQNTKNTHASASASASTENEDDQKSIVMDAVDEEIENENQDTIHSLYRIAKAARMTFENIILSDPLLLSYRSSSNHDNHNNNNNQQHLSKAHQNTLKEITYLSLMNYADLLLSLL